MDTSPARVGRFDAVQAALDWIHGPWELEEILELERSAWARLYQDGEKEAEELRQDAGVVLEAIGAEAMGDPGKAALYAQLLTGQAGLLDALAQLVRDPRFDEVPETLRAAARAFAARALVRVIALELDPDDVSAA